MSSKRLQIDLKTASIISMNGQHHQHEIPEIHFQNHLQIETLTFRFSLQNQWKTINSETFPDNEREGRRDLLYRREYFTIPLPQTPSPWNINIIHFWQLQTPWALRLQTSDFMGSKTRQLHVFS